MNLDQMAAKIGVSPRAFDTFCRKRPEFKRAVNSGGEIADAKIVRSLYDRARGYQHDAVKIFMPAGAEEPVYAPYVEHYPPDTAAAFIWLKNRRRLEWRDRHEVAVEDVTGGFARLPPDQRREMLFSMAERAGLLIEHAPSGFDDDEDGED